MASNNSAFSASTSEKLQTEKNKLSSLNSKEDKLLTELVSLQSSIVLKQKEITLLNNQIEKLNDELAPLNRKAEKVKLDLDDSQSILNGRMKNMYKYGKTNSLEIILSAKNLNDLINRISFLEQIASNDHDVLVENKAKKKELEKIRQKLLAKQNDLITAKDELEKSKDSLVNNKEEKDSFLADLQKDKNNSESIVKKLESEAAAVQTRMAQLQTPSRGGITGVPRGSMRMLATAYCPNSCCGNGSGRTAAGLKAGYGVVAVDPGIIPLGTKLSISGYGNAIAGDTGGAIIGSRIDLGFNTHADAMAFGKQWVTVTILD